MHEQAELVRPSPRYARSYVAALREGFRRGAQEPISERRIRQIEADFAGYIEAITDQTGSTRLPTGQIVPKVSFSVHWLVEGDTFIGEAHVRHRLNDYLIKQGIRVAETDLGEYIIQLADEKPSHIIAPAVHKTRQPVA